MIFFQILFALEKILKFDNERALILAPYMVNLLLTNCIHSPVGVKHL